MNSNSANLRSWLVAVLFAVFAFGCDQPPSGTQAAPQGQPEPAQQQVLAKIEIPLDNVKDGKVSTARNFYFVLDGSGSMANSPPRSKDGDQRFESKIDGAKWAIEEFLKTVPNDVNLGLLIFDDAGCGERVPLGPNNREAFLQAVRGAQANNGTPLIASIKVGTEKLVEQYRKQLGYGEFRLIVVTDGEQTDGNTGELREAVQTATRYGMPIYTIGFCTSDQHPLKQLSVTYRTANSANQLKEGLKAVTAELPNFDPKEFEGAK